MKNYTEKEITRLQNSLQLIRQAGGWSAEEFGEMIGVTKQTISNLENKKTIMSKTQYIAIRAVLDWEIAERENDALLTSTVDLCLNHDGVTPEDKMKAQAFLSGAKKTGLDNGAIVAGLAALVGFTAAATPALLPASTLWLAKIIKNKK